MMELSRNVRGTISLEGGGSGRFVCLVEGYPSCAATGSTEEEAKERALLLYRSYTQKKISNGFSTWLYQVFANGPSQYHMASKEKRDEMEIAYLSGQMPRQYSAEIAERMHHNPSERKDYGL